MDLDAEFQRLYRESPVEVQQQFKTLQEKKEKARELADMVGSVVVDENLSMDVLKMVADLIREDCKQIRQAVKEMTEEQEVAYERT